MAYIYDLKTISNVPIASFSDGADDEPVKSCVVTFTPSGGTPSAPVAITGYTGLTLTNKDNMTTPTHTETYTDTFGQTIYGGERDLTTDKVKATYCAPVTFTGASDENWYYSVSGTKQRVFIALSNSPVKQTTNTLVGNYIKQASAIIGYPNEYEAWINNNGNIVIGVPSTITSASDWKTFLADNNLQVSYIVETPTEITGLTSHEISTMLGDNNFYADIGDIKELQYYSQTYADPLYTIKDSTLTDIAEAIRYKKDTHDRIEVEDFAEEIRTIRGGLPIDNSEDPLNCSGENYASYYNISAPFSGYYVEDGELLMEMAFRTALSSGYEGACFNLSKFNLVEGKTYKLSFELDVPSIFSFSGTYPWGIKINSSRVPSSGSSGGSTFNITPTVDFVQQTGKQNVEATFTATANNYLLVLIGRLSGTKNDYIFFRKIKIEEVTT